MDPREVEETRLLAFVPVLVIFVVAVLAYLSTPGSPDHAVAHRGLLTLCVITAAAFVLSGRWLTILRVIRGIGERPARADYLSSIYFWLDASMATAVLCASLVLDWSSWRDVAIRVAAVGVVVLALYTARRVWRRVRP